MASILLGEEERSEDEDEMGRYSASDSDDYGGGKMLSEVLQPSQIH